jgi:hypothetical protein
VTDPCKDDRFSPHKELPLTAGLAKLDCIVEDNWSRLQIPTASGVSRAVHKEISRIKAHIFVGYTSISVSFFSHHPGKLLRCTL